MDLNLSQWILLGLKIYFDFVSVRPTAFFKSVSGQLELVDGGSPFVYFDLGEDRCATCNPIS